MKHYASSSFWSAYGALPSEVRQLADRRYALLNEKPRHPSLHLKRIGRFWSVRVSLHYRALAVEIEDGLLWFGSEVMQITTSSSGPKQ